MKKVNLLIASLIITGASYAQTVTTNGATTINTVPMFKTTAASGAANNVGNSNLFQGTSWGYIGIGVQAPISTLHLKAPSAVDATKITIERTNPSGFGGIIDFFSTTLPISSSSYLGIINFSANVSGTEIAGAQIMPYAMNAWTATDQSTRLTFKTTNGNTLAEKMTILGNGNVGIGTPNPGSLLTVKNDFQGYTYITADNAFTPAAGVGSGFAVTENNAVAWYLRSERDYSSRFSIGNPTGTKLTISGYGYVGIGTTNPQSLLAVNGTITAKEINVTLTGWSDYVFEQDYKLKNLSEVESYIKENKHLPDVPSASNVIENGANLGDMNRILLQKVEEMTLYMIEMQKQLEIQKQDKELLKDELDKMKNQIELIRD